MVRQAEIAIETADVIVLMVDVKTGVTAADHDVAVMLRKSEKPVVVAVNKVDNVGEVPLKFMSFIIWEWGKFSRYRPYMVLV